MGDRASAAFRPRRSLDCAGGGGAGRQDYLGPKGASSKHCGLRL